jgi:hypothetical protein
MYVTRKFFPTNLVQLEIVHVAACADLRCMHDDEDVVRIHMDSGNGERGYGSLLLAIAIG